MSDVIRATTTPETSSPVKREYDAGEDLSTSPLSDVPPSSPPVIASMARNDNMPPPPVPASKRPREQMTVEHHGGDSSETAVEGKNPDSSIVSSAQYFDYLQTQEQSQQITPPHSTPTGKPVAVSSSNCVVQQPESKASDAKKRKAAEDGAEQNVKEHFEDDQSQSGSQTSGESNDHGPEDRIIDFDWRDLHERFHAKMDELAHKEQELFDEWGQLMEVSKTGLFDANVH